MLPQIHIMGASGAGVSTLGRALAARLACTALDTDDFYWQPTVPPYRDKRAVATRLSLLHAAFAQARHGWVLAGAATGWGDPLIPLFERVVFVDTPTEVRLGRLRTRETAAFGAVNVAPGGERHAEFLEFLEWASRYDHGDREGRSRPIHDAWLARLPCPVLRVDGTRPIADLVARICAARHD